MSTRTPRYGSTTLRGGGNGGTSSSSSPWQRPSSNIGASLVSRPAPPQPSRGYDIPSGNKSRRLLSQMRPPGLNFSPPPATGAATATAIATATAAATARQERERGKSLHYRQDDRRDIGNPNFNFNRDRERERDLDRDQQYRRNPNDYRQNGFDEDQVRYDDRDRSTNMGRGYDDRPQSYNERGEMDESGEMHVDRNDRRCESNYAYNESGDSSSYTANQSRRPTMCGERENGNYDYRRRPLGRSGNTPGNDNNYRDSMSMDHHNIARRGSLDRDHEREQDRLDYQRRPITHSSDTNTFRDHHDNRDCFNSRHSTGREDRNNGGFDNGNFSRNEYNDRRMGQQQWPRQIDQRRPDQSTTFRGDDYNNNNNNNNNGYNDRAVVSNYRTGMGDTRQGEISQRNWEGKEHHSHSSEWNRGSRHPECARGSSMDVRGTDRRPERSLEAFGRGERSDSDGRYDRDRWEHTTEKESVGNADLHHQRYSYGETRGKNPNAIGSSVPQTDGENTNANTNANRKRERERERQREGHGEPTPVVAAKIVRRESNPVTAVRPRHVYHKSSASTSDTTERNSKEGSDEAKKIAAKMNEKETPKINVDRPRHVYKSSVLACDTTERSSKKGSDEAKKVAAKMEEKETTKIKVERPRHVYKSSAVVSDTIERISKQGLCETKKPKILTNASPSALLHASKTNTISTNPGINAKQQAAKNNAKIEVTKVTSSSSSLPRVAPSQTKLHNQPNTKSIPVKASSSLLAKKHQIQAKPKPKPISKLGIPMRWLKPKAKPKPVKKVPPKVPEDSSKSTKIPSKPVPSKKSLFSPSSPSNRLVTDSSEGSSIVSYNKNNTKVASSSTSSVGVKKGKGTSVPAAIVTKKPKQASKKNTKHKLVNVIDDPNDDEEEDEWDSEAEAEDSDDDASDSESDTDDDEVLDWASRMLGVPSSPSSINSLDNRNNDPNNYTAEEGVKTKSPPKLKIRLSAALKLKLTESIQSRNSSNKLSVDDGHKLEAALKKLERRKKKREKLKALSEKINERPEFDHVKAKKEIVEGRRKREEAKPLTAKEIRKILRNDTTSGGDQNNWVRRSRRQPNMALVNSKPVRILVDKLKNNDTDMRVLKMKKYINDPNTPCAVMDAILNAMEENTNCEALYIQNFNEGIRDDQLLHLLKILQQPECKIWCFNIGENYNVSDKTWGKFTKGLIHTKITHMYASEHTITSDMKDEIRFTIRENRKKHDRHINPNNLDVIIQCTHCWWNPINAKVLRPFLKNKGYEHVLKDKEAQGLQGSSSMAPTV